MPSRYRDLLQAEAGYKLTGVPIVAFDGKNFAPAGFSDDPGLYFFAPWISHTFRISLDHGIAVVLFVPLVLGTFVGLFGLIASVDSTVGKVIAAVALLALTAVAYRTGDVYVYEFAACVTLLPWFLYVLRHKSGAGKAFPSFLFAAGLVAGACSLMRSSSAPPVLVVVILSLLLLLQATVKKKAALVAILLVGFAVPVFSFHLLISRRDAFLVRSVAGYQVGYTRHTWGHFIYSGLGFLSNPYVPGGVSDEVAMNKVRSIAPNSEYLSPEYDRVLWHEIALIALHHPVFVLYTLFAKLGVIAGVIAIFANFGLPAAVLYRKQWQLDLAFCAAFGICAAPMVLYVPLPLYLLGVMSLAVVYGVLSLNQAFASRQWSRAPQTDQENQVRSSGRVSVAVAPGDHSLAARFSSMN